MGVWTIWLLLALAPIQADGPGAGIVESFGYKDLTGPDRLDTMRTWVALRHGIGPDLLEFPLVDLVGLLMTGLVDTGTPAEDPELRWKLGLDLCDAMLPRLAPAEAVPDPAGRLWTNPRIVPIQLRNAAATARTDLRNWCLECAAGAAKEDPCRAARIRFVSRALVDFAGADGAGALDEARRHCGNRETSQLSLVRYALAGNDEGFERVRSLLLQKDIEAEPLLAAAVRYQGSAAETRTLARRWDDGRDLHAGRILLREATRRRDLDAVRRLAGEAAGEGGPGRTLATVALVRVGLADEAHGIPTEGEAILRAHLDVFTTLQDALGQRAPDRGALKRALGVLAGIEPGTTRRVRFIADAVAGLSAAYASVEGLELEIDRLTKAGTRLLDGSDDPVLDLGVIVAQLYALEAWHALDQTLDHALRVHSATLHPGIGVAAARILLLVGARLGDVDRVQQAHALLRFRLEIEGQTTAADRVEAGYLALAAELYLGVHGGATAAVLEELARRFQDLDEAAGASLSPSDRSVLYANLFSLSGSAVPSRRRRALADLWRAGAGKPLTLLLTALDRWYDGRYLEAALVLRLLSYSGCGDSLTGTAAAWRDALRRRSGAAVPHEGPVGSAVTGPFKILVDGDLRTRILMGWDGRLQVEIHPADRLLVLPSPPTYSGTR